MDGLGSAHVGGSRALLSRSSQLSRGQDRDAETSDLAIFKKKFWKKAGKTMVSGGSAVGDGIVKTGKAAGEGVAKTGKAAGEGIAKTGEVAYKGMVNTGKAVLNTGNSLLDPGTLSFETLSKAGLKIGSTGFNSAFAVGGSIFRGVVGTAEAAGSAAEEFGETVGRHSSGSGHRSGRNRTGNRRSNGAPGRYL